MLTAISFNNMIKLSYIIPHSPILIPNIGKNNTNIFNKTIESFKNIKQEIIDNNIDTIIIISPHKKNNETISINDHFSFNINFEEFGDYSDKIKVNGDLELSYIIKEELWPDFDINLLAETKPDYGINIPLFLLLSEENQRLKNFKGKIIIINTSTKFDCQHHFEVGKKISSVLQNSSHKIAVIASAELSHCLNYNAPGGFFQKAIMFDEKTIENLKKGKEANEEILKIDPKLALGAKECGLRPISLLLGILDNFPNYIGENMSYQKDLGVGCLTMKMKLD